MKVLKDNYNAMDDVPIENPYPRKMVCERCGSELEYEKSDVRIGVYGCTIVDCPLCGEDNIIDSEIDFALTKDNVEFPTHFDHTSTANAVDCFNNETIKEYIHKAIDYLRKYPDEMDYGGHMTGNLYINVVKWKGDENYEVTVSNDFYNTYIPFEPEDYDDEILF